jgi:hypothetical protein
VNGVLMTSCRRVAAGALLVTVAFPAMAQTGLGARDARDALSKATPRAREYCLARASGRDAALFQCLRFRDRYPLREWRESGPEAPVNGNEVADPVPPPNQFFPRPGDKDFIGSDDTAAVRRCRTENRALVTARENAIRDGRALAEYRIRVLRMTPAEIGAEQARVRANRSVLGKDPVLVQRLPVFLQYARMIAEGERVYRQREDDFFLPIDSAVRRYKQADSAFQAAMTRCIAPPAVVAAPPSPPVAVSTAAWAGTWENGDFRYQISAFPGALNISYQSIRPGLNQFGSHSCIVTGSRAECRGNGTYDDADKRISYADRWSLTLSGDTVSGTWSLDSATPSWKVAATYTSALHTGASGSFSFSRVR